MAVLNTVLLDDPDRGAANPWGAAWSADSRTLVIAHAGTHEISVIAFPAVLAKLAKLMPEPLPANAPFAYGARARAPSNVPEDLSFLAGMRERRPLPAGDLGPRSVVVVGHQAYTANYFSDSVSVIDLNGTPAKTQTVPLGPKPRRTATRLGELWFHDARICLQGWQSCASCHPGEARVDGLNWDLLNDGVGNPKNSKSLLLAFQTPPAMSQGVRSGPEQAVRAGFRHVQFSRPPEAVGLAVDEFLKLLKPVPSPHLVGGQLSDAAIRGRGLFMDDRVGCARCHPVGLYTDLKRYDVGTRARFDTVGAFDTPTLVECWRTAPYLHDGSAATMKEVLTERNRHDQHGHTSHLTPRDIEDLATYVLSL
jgi:YVTN family beta-propeller protein